jgi:membrane protease YdiL (CAAX protease family)
MTELAWLTARLALGPSTAPFHVEDRRTKMRRKIVVAVCLVIGGVLTAFALNDHKTDVTFFILTFALAGTWIVGALVSGPLHLGFWEGKRDLIRPTLLGIAAFIVFLVGDLILRPIPYLHHQIDIIIGHAGGNTALLAVVVAVVNGLGEELFFRGAVYSAFGPKGPLLGATVVYIAVIACAGNPILALAGLIMGTLFALERRATRGILASSATHVVWSLLMIALLPR